MASETLGEPFFLRWPRLAVRRLPPSEGWDGNGRAQCSDSQARAGSRDGAWLCGDGGWRGRESPKAPFPILDMVAVGSDLPP